MIVYSIWVGTLVSCKRRSNRRNRIHGMELDILAIPNRMLVQYSLAIVCVVFGKGQFSHMKEPANGIKLSLAFVS